MRVLVIGGGGREHVLCETLAKSTKLTKLYAAPGNVGIARIAQCVDIAVDDLDGLVRFAKQEQIDLTVVGPEVPLVAGIADRFQAAGLRLFGPSAAAAQLEGSKAFSKELLKKHRIPTAGFRTFNRPQPALDYIAELPHFPIVLKADGLAAGKGVVICRDPAAAEAAVRELMVDQAYGSAGSRLVVEEFLVGTEASVLAIVDGKTIAILEAARDHKAAFDYDKGPNTGGMGAISPPKSVTPELLSQVEQQVLIPTVHAMSRAGRPFRGFLYAGLMLTKGGPKVLEFNVRFGDPEAQAILPRLRSDLLELLDLAVDGNLDQAESIEWDPRPSCTVVLASGGYPGKYETGLAIQGIADAEALDDVSVYHAGTASTGNRVVTNGGRVLAITALGDHMRDACERAYRGVAKIRFQGAFYRSDIGRSEYEPNSGSW